MATSDFTPVNGSMHVSTLFGSAACKWVIRANIGDPGQKIWQLLLFNIKLMSDIFWFIKANIFASKAMKCCCVSLLFIICIGKIEITHF